MVLNIYGPYNDKPCFWDIFFDSQIFQVENLIIGGELNFTMFISNVWGENARVDVLVGYFLNGLVANNLVYVEPL
jgi:hypothetical protein